MVDHGWHGMHMSGMIDSLLPAYFLPTRGLSQAYGLSVDARGGFSGGTLASGFHQAEAEAPQEVAALMGDKYYLWPKGTK